MSGRNGSVDSGRADIEEAGVRRHRAGAVAATAWRYDIATYARHLGLPGVEPLRAAVGGEAGLRHLPAATW